MTTLNLVELFASVQGETTLSGLPTFFIRLAACNLRCSWCDTPYSFGRGDPVQIEEIAKKTVDSGCRHVCVTGGEPLLQKNVHPLMEMLCDAGLHVSIETGGSLPIEPMDSRVKVVLDIKCPGSGMESKNFWDNISSLKATDEVKFVLLDRLDYQYAKSVCEKYDLYKNEVLFSPVHNKLNAQELVGWILEDKLPVRLNLQIHKFIWTPETKGV
jgi:7-carboxy-7-deazaguanine synthase